ncbi:MAG: hypothetical protein JW914_01500 [Syntrophaceae bacterium]|nr:hypothetical protein [Syntrophaceae bacterium]
MSEIIFDENEDWEKRILCSDESCIGTIGTDGLCKECGKGYEGKLPEGHGTVSSKPIAHVEQKTEEKSSEDDDWEKRVLCSDESCIGVIGPDGKCKECGKQLK